MTHSKLAACLLAPVLLQSCANTNQLAPTVSNEIETIVPEVWEDSYNQLHYAPAVKAGDMLILSGVVASLGTDQTMADAPAAYTWAFEAIGEILEASGADWDDVVEIVTFHTDLPAQINAFGMVKDNYLTEPYPAWTAIDIDRLYPDGGLVEIKVTAYVPD